MNFRYSWLFFICLFFYSCCQQDNLPLTRNLITWSPYDKHQEITYTNQAGQSLTFKTITRHYEQSGEDKVCGTYNIETYEATLVPLSDPNFNIQIVLSHEVLVNIKAFITNPAATNLDIQFNAVSKQYVSDDWRDLYLKSVDLNGKNHQTVLRFFGIPVNHPLAFKEVYYAKDEGLVAFKTYAGDWYYLQ